MKNVHTKKKIVKCWFSNHVYVFAVLQCCKCQRLHPDSDTLWIEAASWIIKSSAAIFRRTVTIKRRQLETVEISCLVKDNVIMDVADFSVRILRFRGWSLSKRGPKFTFLPSRPPRHSPNDCWTVNCCWTDVLVKSQARRLTSCFILKFSLLIFILCDFALPVFVFSHHLTRLLWLPPPVPCYPPLPAYPVTDTLLWVSCTILAPFVDLFISWVHFNGCDLCLSLTYSKPAILNQYHRLVSPSVSNKPAHTWQSIKGSSSSSVCARLYVQYLPRPCISALGSISVHILLEPSTDWYHLSAVCCSLVTQHWRQMKSSTSD